MRAVPIGVSWRAYHYQAATQILMRRAVHTGIETRINYSNRNASSVNTSIG